MLTINRIEMDSIDTQLISEWQQLLTQSTRPSIYSSFEYLSLSFEHFVKADCPNAFLLAVRIKENHKLIALFPVAINQRQYRKRKIRVVEHLIATHNSDVDKPYPLIHNKFEVQSWQAFAAYFKTTETRWDWIEYLEVIGESQFSQLVNRSFQLPKFWVKNSQGPESPMVSLQGSWQDFWDKHRNLRKKARRMEKRLGENYQYKVFNEVEDMAYCLNTYIATEELSWKAGKGLSEAKGKGFYQELLLLLAEKGQVYFGILYDGNTAVSVELSYTFMDKVYFAQGTYNPKYQHLSPGSVSTAKFIEYFYGKGFKQGDFLAGFADYLNPWADEIYPSQDIHIFKVNALFFYYAFFQLIVKMRKLLNRKVAPV